MGGNITRRSFLALCGASALACGPTTEGDDEPMTIAPWHMWGGSAAFNATTLSPGLNYRQEGQLARIQYKRPESWRFLFYARILESESSNPAILTVNFNIIPGVGRTAVSLQGFERYRFSIPIGVGGAQEKYSASVNGPERDDVTPQNVQNEIDSIEAQDLQVSYSANVVLTIPGDFVTAEIGVILAPWHHARPDWFGGRFLAQETGGS